MGGGPLPHPGLQSSVALGAREFQGEPRFEGIASFQLGNMVRRNKHRHPYLSRALLGRLIAPYKSSPAAPGTPRETFRALVKLSRSTFPSLGFLWF